MNKGEIIQEWFRCYTDGKTTCSGSAVLDLLKRLEEAK